MVTENTNHISEQEEFSGLLPLRHPQQDLFICDVGDAVLKNIMADMEHPFYSLSKKPETKIRRYESNGNWIQVTPSVNGLATIYDKDILIYCISQVMDALKKGQPVSQRVRINSHELLVFTNRGTSGRDYMALAEALDRLGGTRISTNIRTGDQEQFDTFGLIDSASIRRKHGLDGRLLWCEVKLSDWVFNAIRSHEVLTLHRDYFRLRKPIERRIYEVARKHCGQQPTWKISLEKLIKKTGSQSPMKRFRQMVKELAECNHLPDYQVSLVDDDAIFTNRNTLPNHDKQVSQDGSLPNLNIETYEKARRSAPGYDIYALEQEWRDHWITTGKPVLQNPDSAFIGFCKHRHLKKAIHCFSN